MSYGGGGKNWNVGLSDPGRLGAMRRQLFHLHKLTGRDYRGRGLTRDQASDLIEEALREKNERKEGLNQMADQFFNATFAKAVFEANAAGEAWLGNHSKPLFSVADPETGQMIGVNGNIGYAWITWPRPGSPFHKWLIDNVYDGDRKAVAIPHRYAGRLEGELVLACEKAALDTLRRGAASAAGELRLMYRCDRDAAPKAA